MLFFGVDDSGRGGEGAEDTFCKAFDGCYVVGEDGSFFAEFLYGGVCKRGVFEEDPCMEGVGFREGCVFGEDGGEGVICDSIGCGKYLRCGVSRQARVVDPSRRANL